MLESELVFIEASTLCELIAKKKLSPVEVAKAYLKQIEELDPKLNAFLTICADSTIKQARDAEAAIMRGEMIGPLHGLVIPVKDLVQTAEIRTTWGSQVYKDFVPNHDDIVAKRIRSAGGIIIGKTNTSEFGHLATTENLLRDACRNPWSIDRTSGGSSGGAAVAVAAGLAPIAQGGDGGGSIRIPSSFCGVFGFKPTHGRIPREYRTHQGGWETLSQDGPISRSVKDAMLLLQVLAGPDPNDPRSLGDYKFQIDSSEPANLSDLRIGLISSFKGTPVDSRVRQLIERSSKVFEDFGASVEEIVSDFDELGAREIFKTIFLSDLFASVGPLLRTNAELLMPSLRKFLEDTSMWGPARLPRALRGLEWHRDYFRRLFAEYDILLTPTVAVGAFPLGDLPKMIDGIEVDPIWGFNPFCYQFNMTGGPASNVPCGFINGLPVGMQIVGQSGADNAVLRASAAFEIARPWMQNRPPISSKD